MLKSLPFYSSLLGLELTAKKKAGKVHVLLYGAIEVHSHGPKGCIAGNEDLSESTGITKSEIRRYLSEIKQGGWVDYDVGKGNKRGKILPLLKIETPLRNNSTTLAEKTTRPLRNNSADTIDNSIDNSREDTSGGESPPQDDETANGRLCVHIGKESGELCGKNAFHDGTLCVHHAVQEVVDLFAPVNESYLTLYGNKTQHKAVKDLIKTYKREELMGAIKILPKYNKMPYRASGDKIYNPYDLLKKWSVMKDNLISYKLQENQRIQDKQGAIKTIVR